MGYNIAAVIFLALKCVILIWLLLLWKKKFIGKEKTALFYFFTLLAFNSAVYLDMRAGNVNLLEQALLWAGFYYFIKRRYVLFCTFILAAASFKMIPIFFLFLLFFSKEKHRLTYFGFAGLAFAVYLFGQYLWFPAYFFGFVENIFVVMKDNKIIAPSTYTLINDVSVYLNKAGIATVPILIVSIISAIILILTTKTYLTFQRLNARDHQKIAIFLMCLMYALILPRFKDYSYILLIVPAFYIIQKVRYIKTLPFLFILCILSAKYLMLPGASSFFSLLWNYYPLLIAYGIWGIYIYEMISHEKWYCQQTV